MPCHLVLFGVPGGHAVGHRSENDGNFPIRADRVRRGCERLGIFDRILWPIARPMNFVTDSKRCNEAALSLRSRPKPARSLSCCSARPVGAIIPCLDIAGPDRLVAAMGQFRQLQPPLGEGLSLFARRIQIYVRFDFGEELPPGLYVLLAVFSRYLAGDPFLIEPGLIGVILPHGVLLWLHVDHLNNLSKNGCSRLFAPIE